MMRSIHSRPAPGGARSMAKPRRSSYPLRGKLALPLLVALSAALLFATHGGCLVEERCFSESDCAKGELCKADGRCGVSAPRTANAVRGSVAWITAAWARPWDRSSAPGRW